MEINDERDVDGTVDSYKEMKNLPRKRLQDDAISIAAVFMLDVINLKKVLPRMIRVYGTLFVDIGVFASIEKIASR